MRSRLRLVLAVSALFASACAPPSEEVASSADAIVGGAEDDDKRSDSRPVGYLALDDADNIRCTGSLVSIPGVPRVFDNRIVLTAAHCVAKLRHDEPSRMGSLRFGFGTRFDRNAQFRVATVLDHPTYLRTADTAYDLALLVLDEPVLERKPLEIGPAVFDKQFTAIGYGNTTNATYGVKRRLDTHYDSFTSGAPLDDAGATPTGFYLTRADSADSSACFGDSGGPLLVRGTQRLVGVASFVEGASTPSGCLPGGRNAFASVLPHALWMREVLRECAVSQRFFSETGIYVCGKIKDAWEDAAYGNSGGFNSALGLPLATASYQRNGDGTDRSYIAQWFERARVEHHPEEAAPYDVGFGRLGVEVYGRNEAGSRAVPGIDLPGCEWIAGGDGRGAFVCGDMLAAFHRGGGVRMLGLPISTERRFVEMTDAYRFDGTVQWFERGRLERHPEISGSPVLFGKLGCHSSGFDAGLASLRPADDSPAPTTLGCARRLFELHL